ncbi:MFS transporter [Pontibacillus chungwhensis BH030062]|uniref:MFS transporter n=1 Tax=Pontibacillus chungwhensis BH030062 TaxID=1385513 RepID=A0A0A2V052_9BACI|nr:MFS transporter [Pontibacillus chungwhensis]KGP92196.1 MFS transporter [Pontibacillus chungwhensis BH030062]
MVKGKIYLSYFVAEVGRAMYFVIITWYLYKATEDAFYTGLLVSLGFLPGLLLNMVFGVLVDRFNRKYLIILSLLVSMAAVLVLGGSVTRVKVAVLMIFIIHMLLQAMGSLLRPAIQAFVAEQFDHEELPRVYSLSASFAIIGSMMGATSGGMLTGWVGASGALIWNGVAYGLALIAIILVPSIEGNRKKSQKSGWEDFKEGVTYLHNHALLKRLFVIMFVGQMVFHSTIAFLSVYASEVLEVSALVYGWLDASLSVGGAIAGFFGAWLLRRFRSYITMISLLVIVAGLLILASSSVIAGAFIGVCSIGIGTTWIRVLLQTVQQLVTDAQYHGRMASFRMLFNQGSVVISGPLLGWIAGSFGAHYVFFALMILVIVITIFSISQSSYVEFESSI